MALLRAQRAQSMAINKVDRKHDDIPDDVYIQFVRSLFDNARILLIGGACYAVIAFMVFIHTHNSIYLFFAFVLLAVNVWRYAGIQNFHRQGGVLANEEDARRWERNYIIRGSAQGLALGAFSFFSIYVYPNPYAETASVALAVSSLLTVVTRNYGSPAMVRILSAMFIGPIALALVLRMELPHVILGLLIFPLMYITIYSSAHLRNVLFAAVTGHRQAKQLAQRFDRALNTMPQGLLMFNAQGQVIVANAEAAFLTNMPTPDAMLGRTISALLLRIVAAGTARQGPVPLCHHAADRGASAGFRPQADHHVGRWPVIRAVGPRRRPEHRCRHVRGHLDARARRETHHDDGPLRHPHVAAQPRALPRTGRRATGQRRSGRGTAPLAIFDLDDFKGVNDSLGHPVGDQLIRAVSERLAPFASKTVIVSRFGGDEFVIYCDEMDNVTASQPTAGQHFGAA